MIQSIDEKLAHLELPMAPARLSQVLAKLTDDCNAYDFVADRGARKARECWIACQFLVAHGKHTGRSYKVTDLLLEKEAPDIRYQEVAQPRTDLFIEVAELISPDRKRCKEYLRKKQQRQAGEQTDQKHRLPATSTPDEAEYENVDIEAERRVFPAVASERLEDKLKNDYRPDCTLVLYVNLGLFGDEPIREFAATYTFSEPVRFQEIWFLYRETIIPLVSCPSTK